MGSRKLIFVLVPATALIVAAGIVIPLALIGEARDALGAEDIRYETRVRFIGYDDGTEKLCFAVPVSVSGKRVISEEEMSEDHVYPTTRMCFKRKLILNLKGAVAGVPQYGMFGQSMPPVLPITIRPVMAGGKRGIVLINLP